MALLFVKSDLFLDVLGAGKPPLASATGDQPPAAMARFALLIATLLAAVDGFRPTALSAPGTRGAVRSDLPVMAATAAEDEATRVIMKFGGSSVRDATRITEVCNLVKLQRSKGIQPHMVCSAMGKTTNGLLAAADLAVQEGRVDLSAVRQLHEDTATTLGLLEHPGYASVVELLDECELALSGVSMLRELSPRTRDRVVSYGERMSGRMVAAQLENIGVPSVQLESWVRHPEAEPIVAASSPPLRVHPIACAPLASSNSVGSPPHPPGFARALWLTDCACVLGRRHETRPACPGMLMHAVDPR